MQFQVPIFFTLISNTLSISKHSKWQNARNIIYFLSHGRTSLTIRQIILSFEDKIMEANTVAQCL